MSQLNETQSERVAARIAREYAYLGVTYQAALAEVRQGKWDDHPLAAALLRAAR